VQPIDSTDKPSAYPWHPDRGRPGTLAGLAASVSEAVNRFSLRLRSGHALLTFFFPKESKGSLTIEYLGSVMFRRE